MDKSKSSAVEFSGTSRVHIGLTVSDLNQSKQFYQTLLGQVPTKERPDYIKFEAADPSVNLSLNQSSRTLGRGLPVHYGIQVQSSGAVAEAVERFKRAGLDAKVEEDTTCCYSVQDKVWVHDPDGNQWEVFVVIDADAEERIDPNSNCCEGIGRVSSPCCAA